MPNTKYLLLGMAALLLTSCVTAQSDVDSLRHRVQALEQRQQADRRNLAQQLEDYQYRLEAVDQMVSEAGGSVQATQANLWAEVESMRVQVATLTGRLDSLERQYMETREERGDINQTLTELRSRTRELDRSVQMLSSQLGVEIAGADPVPAPPPSPVPGEPAAPEPDQADAARAETARPLYQQALNSFYDRDYARAQSLWEEFTDHFPDHALAANAYFWQGESFFQMEDYARAALAYQEVITNFPESDKIVSSMLKQGMSFIHLGREEAGELVLSELVKKYPDTAEARRARAFMSDHLQ